MKNKNTLKVVGIILALVPFVTFPEYVLGSTLYKIFHLYFFISCAALITVSIKKKASTKDLLYALIPIVMLLPSMLQAIQNHYTEAVNSGLKLMLGSFSIIFSMRTASKKQEDFELFLRAIKDYYGIIVFLNILSFLIFYPGMGATSFYLIGNDNGSIFEAHLYVFSSLIYYKNFREKVPTRFYFSLIAILLGYMFVWSGNGMILSVLFIVFAFISNSKKKIPAKTFVILYSIAIWSIVILNDTTILSPILKFFGKSTTISGRTYVWELAMNRISQSPLFGIGFEPNSVTVKAIWINRTHDFALQLLYTGGIYLLLCFVALMICLFRKIKNRQYANIYYAAIILFLLAGIADFYMFKMTTPILLSIIALTPCGNSLRSIK